MNNKIGKSEDKKTQQQPRKKVTDLKNDSDERGDV